MAEMRSIKFHPDFADELVNAIAYYEEVSIDASTKFKQAVEKQLRLIEVNPLYKSVRFDRTRFARIDGFPYVIQYSIEAGIEAILVHTIVSDHQNPDTSWRKKW